MSCNDNTCGIGGSTLPPPGDPDNNVTLSANTVYAGINVNWSYPTINAHAVAHTKLYRNTSNNFATALEHAIVGGSIYFDRLDPQAPTTYYYWIRIVSVNGTVGEPVGPVSAVAQPLAEQTLESLTGKIDNGVLAQSLKTSISGITLNNQLIYKEIEDRLNANTELSNALQDVRDGVTESLAYINEEIIQRQDADGALVTQLNTMAAAIDDNTAAILEEKTVRVSVDEAMATTFTALYSAVDDNKAAIVSEATTRTTNDTALSQRIDSVVANVGTVAAAVKDETTARINAVSGVASRVTTTEVAINGNVATGQVGLTSKVTTLDGKVTSIGALYTAKVEVNGLIGGFGVYNDGSSVEAGFDVDTFWVGRTNANKVKPFIISNDTVYIDKARIRNADIDTLKIAGNSIVTGTFATGFADSVSSNGTVNLISRTVDLGDSNNSGLIVSCTIYCAADNDETVGFRVLINGVTAGDQRANMRNGYGMLFPASGFGVVSGRYATVVLQAYATGGAFSITSSTMAILGGKR
jgi:hypothetical protein